MRTKDNKNNSNTTSSTKTVLFYCSTVSQDIHTTETMSLFFLVCCMHWLYVVQFLFERLYISLQRRILFSECYCNLLFLENTHNHITIRHYLMMKWAGSTIQQANSRSNYVILFFMISDFFNDFYNYNYIVLH